MKAALRRALASSLPGRAAQSVAWPDHLPARELPEEEESYGPASVLLAVCPAGAGGYSIPLIRRHGGLRHHPGQISLPGGRCSSGEDPALCALREAEEEIGLPPERVEVLGFLTAVPVSVSRYRIQPVVGWVSAPPQWRPQAEEVTGMLLADPDDLVETGPASFVFRERGGFSIRAPAYLVLDGDGREEKVWGATAIILAEFLAVWRTARSGVDRP